jgi:hypothetical protein
MNDYAGFDAGNQVAYPGAVADVQLMMGEPGQFAAKAGEIPGCVSFRTEEVGAHVVVQSMDRPILLMKELRDRRADESAAARHQNALHCVEIRNSE